MKRKLLSTGFFLMMLGFSAFSQSENSLIVNRKLETYKGTPTMSLPAPNLESIRLEDQERDRNGEFYRIGVSTFTDITPGNSGTWQTLPNGDRVWQLHVKMSGAEALSFLFSTMKIYDNSTIDVFGNDGNRLHATFTKADVLDHFQQNLALCFGDEMTLQLKEPVGSRASEVRIETIIYNYRSTGNPNVPKINESENCEINVNCSPVGDNWQEEKRGVARIYVVEGAGAGWCSGSLMNNTALDCKPLFLTALHCGVNATTANLNNWRFYFRYEAPTCNNPATAGTLDDHYINGCVKLASSNDNGGTNGSDFLLVQLGSLANEAATVTTLKTANYNAYWNGWDANTTATTGGAGIHHPAGDIKKISTFNGSTVSTYWQGGSPSGTHWQMSWSSNANGHGVTEGGSSGSPLFNNSGRVIGTLTGGSSYCTALTSPDVYGKMSFHWTSNGVPANEQLKTYLDPGNTGALVLNGSADPCNAVTPTAPVAEFVGNPTTVSVGGTVSFTDQSTNGPTSWSWSINPATGWSYAGGTSASSQNPQVTFTTPGQYTIALTASNSAGSDTETKTNYISVTTATNPCTATSTSCDADGEFVQNVTLQTINNTTACNMYASYSSSATLVQGMQYTVSVTTQIAGGQPGSAYVDDEVSVWIDWNDDLDFTDVGEQVGYAIATQSAFDTDFEFTVPGNATIGQLAMRVRLSYEPTDGAIAPCGSTTFGEVEDYVVNILGASGIEENGIFAGVAVFPNPTSNNISVDLSAVSAENVSVTLIDMTGKVLAVKENAAGAVAQFDMAAFAKGMYQVRISDGSTVTTRKVTKL
jgi:lysyl endopeptidase